MQYTHNKWDKIEKEDSALPQVYLHLQNMDIYFPKQVRCIIIPYIDKLD